MRDKMGIKYSLLADFHPTRAMSEKYGGVPGGQGHHGRAIAIVNKAGKVAWFRITEHSGGAGLKEVAAALCASERPRTAVKR